MGKVMIRCLACYTDRYEQACARRWWCTKVDSSFEGRSVIFRCNASDENTLQVVQKQRMCKWWSDAVVRFSVPSSGLRLPRYVEHSCLQRCAVMMLCLWVSSSRRFENSQYVRARNQNVDRCTPTTRKEQRCDSPQASHLCFGKEHKLGLLKEAKRK